MGIGFSSENGAKKACSQSSSPEWLFGMETDNQRSDVYTSPYKDGSPCSSLEGILKYSAKIGIQARESYSELWGTSVRKY